jgi:NADPH:quinone reductase-like Zn-dependent oxidoreductase
MMLASWQDGPFAVTKQPRSTKTMGAIQFHEFGGPDVLRYEDVPKPKLKPGEVLVRVHAAGVNPPDWYLRNDYEALPALRPSVTLPLIPGSDVSGIVEAVAKNVEGFSVGDEVFGMIRVPSFGQSAAYAQFVAAPASDLALKPRGIDHVHAAGAPMSGLTAWQFLIEQGHNVPNPLQPEPHRPVPLKGKRVLINGAAGGVGHIAVQLAKWQGAYVIAVASGEQETFLRELGADEFIDYTQILPEDQIRDLDLVLDTMGGATTGRFLRTLKRGGALFPVLPGFADAAEAAERGVTVSMTQVRSSGPQLAEVGRLLDGGTVRIAIDSTFPLADARRAHERAARGHVRGKIVLTVE